MNRLARVAALWGPGLPRAIVLLQAGNAINAFGYGLILPFEIIYLHQARGFGLATSGLVLATVMGTAAVASPPVGASLDRFHAKPVLIAGSLASALGYGALAFITSPWQGFLCSAVAGLGFAAASVASPTLIMTLVTRDQRPSSIALSRVAVNLGLGSGATVGGFILAASQSLSSFQTLYLFDAATYVGFSLVVLFAVSNVRPAATTRDEATQAGYRAVARDKIFLALVGANVILTIVGYSFFGNILGPYAKTRTSIGPGAIGTLFLINTAFIVVAQLPATRVVKRIRRAHSFALIGALWALACVGVLLATIAGSPLAATLVLAAVAIAFAIGECVHFVVLSPTIVELAPQHLLGRYMSLYGLSFTAGLALGPALGASLLAISPDAVWWSGAIAAGAVGIGLYRLAERIPDSLDAITQGAGITSPP